MYIILCGYPPFGGNSDEIILKRVFAGQFSFPSPEWDAISSEAKDLISKMLMFDANLRISASEALNHPWITNASHQQLDVQQAVSIFNNMKQFRAGQYLHKATLTFIATQLSTKGERDEMLETFKAIDTDNSGTIDRQEMIAGYSKIFGEAENVEEEVDKIMAEVDTDKSGEIDYTEFVIATMNRQKLLSRERLQAAFNAFDKDGSGSISADELREMLGKG